MKYLLTLFMCVLVALLVTVGVSQAFGGSRDPRGRSFVQWFLFEVRRTEALQQRAALMNRLWEMKAAAVEDFIADRTTLQEVMDRFEEAEDLLDDDAWGVVGPYHRPQSMEQKCRQIIGWVEDELRGDPEKACQIIHRIKQELAEATSRGEVVR